MAQGFPGVGNLQAANNAERIEQLLAMEERIHGVGNPLLLDTLLLLAAAFRSENRIDAARGVLDRAADLRAKHPDASGPAPEEIDRAIVMLDSPPPEPKPEPERAAELPVVDAEPAAPRETEEGEHDDHPPILPVATPGLMLLVRMIDPVGTAHGAAGDPITAEVLAPPEWRGLVHGRISAIAAATCDHPARLCLAFEQFEQASARAGISTRVVASGSSVWHWDGGALIANLPIPGRTAIRLTGAGIGAVVGLAVSRRSRLAATVGGAIAGAASAQLAIERFTPKLHVTLVAGSQLVLAVDYAAGQPDHPHPGTTERVWSLDEVRM